MVKGDCNAFATWEGVALPDNEPPAITRSAAKVRIPYTQVAGSDAAVTSRLRKGSSTSCALTCRQSPNVEAIDIGSESVFGFETSGAAHGSCALRLGSQNENASAIMEDKKTHRRFLP